MDGFGTEFLKEKIHSKTIGRLISDEMISSAAMSIADGIQEAVDKNGIEYVKPIVKGKLDSIDSNSVEALLNQAGNIDIAGVIENKINGMPVDELERLILSVMKKELNTIVSLGALIGVVLGLINNII